MLVYFLLVLGLIALVVGGEALVRGAVGLAERLQISPLIIGLTIVAFGTSAPELFISVKAALSGVPGIAIGNVVGSNIANVLLVMGLPALLAPSRCNDKGIGRNIMVMIGFTLVFITMLIDGRIGRFEGGALLALLGLFIFDQFNSAKKNKKNQEDLDYHDEVSNIPAKPVIIASYLIVGLIALPLGANLTVEAATAIAKSWNVSDAVIGLTIIAIGTSLPELATAIMATIRGNSALAIGNVVGSNIFNIGSIMGITAIIKPMSVGERIMQLDMWVMLACAMVIAILAHWKIKIGKRVGVAMTAFYTLYVIATFTT